jgi:arginase
MLAGVNTNHAGRIAVIGAALDLGQDRRGVDMGPSAIRYAGLQARLEELGFDVHDLGNLVAGDMAALSMGDERAKYLDAILVYCAAVADAVEQATRAGEVPLVLGGDHSVGIGVLGGLARTHGAPGAVIWIDAHGDINTPDTSPSGNVHGMPVAAALGRGRPWFDSAAWPLPMIDEARTAMIGIRSLDTDEREVLRRSTVRVVTMAEIDRLGMEGAVEVAIDRLRAAPWVHVSLDMDAMDPLHAPGVGTPVPGGISYREAHLMMEMLADSGLVQSLQVVEVNPILDEANRSAALAVELICSALGKKIL